MMYILCNQRAEIVGPLSSP